MQTLLIVGGNTDGRRIGVDQYSSSSISQFDITHLEGETLGIGEIRKLIHAISLKPTLSQRKIIIIHEAQTLTREAQNALLKTLEEPPEDTTIILTAPNSDLLLPTIVSRCQITNLAANNKQLTAQELGVCIEQLELILRGQPRECLKLAQDITKTQDAILWLENMLIAGRQNLIDTITKKETYSVVRYLEILHSLQKAHMLLKTTNVNPRLTLENLFLNG